MSTAMKPREGSPADIAIKAITANGKAMDEFDLAVAMDCTENMVAERLAYAIRTGLIIRSKFGAKSFYKIGGFAAPAAAEESAAVTMTYTEPMATTTVQAPKPSPLPVAAWSPIAKSKPAANDEPAAKIDPVPQFLNPRTWVPAGGDADLSREPADLRREPVGMVRDAKEIADDATAAANDGVMHAREIVASVFPLLTVERFDCATYIGGRLLLEIDGVPCILNAEQVDALTDCLQLAQAMKESRA